MAVLGLTLAMFCWLGEAVFDLEPDWGAYWGIFGACTASGAAIGGLIGGLFGMVGGGDAA